MTREMLITKILAVNGSLKESYEAIDEYSREVALDFFEYERGIPCYLMDNSYEHFLETQNKKL